jgi:hypothetical protein
MGQQQLLLLVLGIVIVGLAVVVGIQAFSENQKKANADAMVMDGIRIASDLQAWMLKPVAFGGAGNSLALWANVTFEQLGYEATGAGAAAIYDNLNGLYTLFPSAGEVRIEGESLNGSQGSQKLVCVTVSGTGPEDIVTEILTL